VSAESAGRPSGVVTFLFTDVEGSTRRWEADADGMRAAVAAQRELELPVRMGLATGEAELRDGDYFGTG
jgi:class 3 adenylate cyclase